MTDFLTLTLGHDLRLVVRPVLEKMETDAPPAVIGYKLLATANDPTKVLGELGECWSSGPSDGMLTIAAEEAARMFPNHARAIPPAEEKFAAPHVFVRDREKPGYVCKCGQDANTNVHGR